MSSTRDPRYVDVETVEHDLLGAGRALFGVTGAFQYGPLRAALRAAGVGGRPAIGMAGVATLAVLPIVVVATFDDEMSRSFGGYGGQLRLLVFAAFVVGMVAGAQMAGRTTRRVDVTALAGAVTGVGLVLAALGTFWGALASLTVAAAGGGVALVVLLPLLFDTYPPEARGRLVCVCTAGVIASIGGAHAAIVLASSLGLSWRAALLGLAGAALGIGALVLGTPEPPVGAWDELPLADEAHEAEGGLGPDAAPGSVPGGFVEQVRRVAGVPTVAAVLPVALVCGLLALPAQRYVAVLWRDALGVGQTGWHRWSVLVFLGGLAGLVHAGRKAEVAYRASPARLLQLASWLCTLAAGSIAVVAVAGNLAVAVAAWTVAVAGFASALACSVFAVVGLTHPRRRAHATALVVASFAVGAQFGSVLLETIGSRFGATWGLLAGAAALLAAARGVNAAVAGAPRDLDALVTSIVDEESLRAIVTRGARVPLLGCRGIDFSYGQQQVLFGVDFTVDDGEMVALLGTNGAGKSTLLRVISGLGLPTAGTVRFRGTDITYTGTDRRVELGISQIPGGKAVFGPMTVAENLGVYGYTHGRDRAAVQRGIDATFEAFPRLAERRNQLAATLSGGEQQMLALGKALILRPQLLLIDELSLGLAPIVVGDLLKLVRRINDAGTAVVLVEQSVNIALSLVHHAYFMEKGEIRFDGPAAELIERPDLLRSVFLEGAATAVGEPA